MVISVVPVRYRRTELENCIPGMLRIAPQCRPLVRAIGFSLRNYLGAEQPECLLAPPNRIRFDESLDAVEFWSRFARLTYILECTPPTPLGISTCICKVNKKFS